MHLDLIDKHYVFFVHQGQRGEIVLIVTNPLACSIEIFCADDVQLTIRVILLLSPVADIKLSIIICGNRSIVSILGLCALVGSQTIQLKTSQIHCGKNTQSRLIVKSIVTDNASFMYDGMIRIQKDASQTYALQNNKNILLSSMAKVISIPNIEVLNYDVQCYHGAAISKFDQEQIQYMQSRCLPAPMIKQLLVQAFFAEVLDMYEKKEFILSTIYEKI